MNIAAYLTLVGNRITEAEQAGNRGEVIRLLRLMADVCLEQIEKIKQGH